MNRHTKLALIIAPFLAIGGYGATDYYMRNKSHDEQLLKLNLEGECNLTSRPCTLTADQISIELHHSGQETQLKTTFPLDLVTVSFTDANGKESIHHMIPDEFRLNWHADTQFADLQNAAAGPITVRLGAIYNNLKYLHEFRTGL
jgi:hypothetical protein